MEASGENPKLFAYGERVVTLFGLRLYDCILRAVFHRVTF